MDKSSYPPKTQRKYKERQCILNACADRPKSKRMIAEETGVSLNSVQWHVFFLQKQNRLFFEKYATCEVSGRAMVKHYSSNPVWL
jgi:hypothetical protein